MSGTTILLPFQPSAMATAQLAAVSNLARYSARTHALYAYQLRRWFRWGAINRTVPACPEAFRFQEPPRP